MKHQAERQILPFGALQVLGVYCDVAIIDSGKKEWAQCFKTGKSQRLGQKAAVIQTRKRHDTLGMLNVELL